MGFTIVAYNFVDKYSIVRRARTNEEVDQIVADLLATGKYSQAGITVRWNARTGD